MLLLTIVRWVHIGCAIIALGGPFFIRFGLLPPMSRVLTPEKAQELREAINARWRIVVYVMITLLLLSGVYTFFITARWMDFSAEERRQYHLLFGIKMMAVLAVFILASALTGRSKMFAPIRQKAKFWMTMLLLFGAVIVVCGGLMRGMYTHPDPVQVKQQSNPVPAAAPMHP